MSGVRRYWLVKSEADDYSIEDLSRDGSTHWTGVRNFQARNFMRDDMSVGDLVLYYQSGRPSPGVVGVARVSEDATPDPTQFDAASSYFDDRATKADPRWWLVTLEFVERFPRTVPLQEIKRVPALKGMTLVTRSRLSVQPVSEAEFALILEMAGSTR